MQLKLRGRTGTHWEGAFKVSHGLHQRIGLPALGRWLLSAKPRAQSVQAAPQFLPQLVEGLQGKGQARRRQNTSI